MSFDATYDACVLHPAGLRDFLVRLAMTGLFRAHWSEDIDDFPMAILETYGIEPQTPDIFVLHLIELSPTTVSGVIQAQATSLKAPPMSVSDVLDRLARSGLPRSVAALKGK